MVGYSLTDLYLLLIISFFFFLKKIDNEFNTLYDFIGESNNENYITREYEFDI